MEAKEEGTGEGKEVKRRGMKGVMCFTGFGGWNPLMSIRSR